MFTKDFKMLLSFLGMDGSTKPLERQKLVKEFNDNPHIKLFLMSTKTSAFGINLVAANRVIIFDPSWNPCCDVQALSRVYRYGQQKPTFVYRLITDSCLERNIYDRQVNKQVLSCRVVDESNPQAHLTLNEAHSIFTYNENLAHL